MVLIAAAQSFGIDAGRAVGLRRLTDSLVLSRSDDSSAVGVAVSDTMLSTVHDSILTGDSTALKDSAQLDSILKDTVKVAARDTIVIPDSLEQKDPFFFKYYIAVKAV